MTHGQRLIDLVLPVAAVERRKALCSFALFAVMMASYYVFKPARGSLYVHYLGAANLPHAYIASVLVALVVMWIYNRAFVRLDSARLLNGSVLVLASCAVAFWAVERLAWLDPAVWSTLVFLWVGVYGVLVATLFWSLQNDVVDEALARRVYSFVGVGGVTGAMLGATLTSTVVGAFHVATEHLLLVGAVVLLLALPLMAQMRRSSASTPAATAAAVADRAAEPPGAAPPPRRDGWRVIGSDPYVAAIAALIFVTTFAGTLFDLQYNHVLEWSVPGKDAKTKYLSDLYGMINVASIAIQLLITGPVHRRYGPLPGLWLLPLVALVAPIVMLSAPTLRGVTVLWVVGPALLYSINQSSKEQLYIPTGHDAKYGAKGYIDVFFFRLGDGAASLIALLSAQRFRPPSWIASVLAYLAAAAWLGLVWVLGRRYRRLSGPGGGTRS